MYEAPIKLIRQQMEIDIRTAESYGSESIDKPEWMKFLKEVQDALKLKEDQ